MRPSRWWWILAGSLLLHIGWGLLRVPTKVVGRRLADMSEFSARSAAEALFAANGLHGAADLDWVRANTPEQCVVLWTGSEVGAMEFAAALLWPRLVVAAAAVGAAAEHAGRPVAVAARGDRRGRVLLVGAGKTLRVEVGG